MNEGPPLVISDNNTTVSDPAVCGVLGLSLTFGRARVVTSPRQNEDRWRCSAGRSKVPWPMHNVSIPLEGSCLVLQAHVIWGRGQAK